MGKRNNKAKRSLSSLPNGLVQRKSSSTKKVGGGGGGSRMGFDPNSNPFEMTAKQKRPKHVVHNRPIAKPKTTKHALESLQRRQSQLRSTIHSSKKANQLIDRRIGQYDPTMTQEDQMLARLVKERTRQSQRVAKFRLDDDDNDGDGVNLLTHKGKKLDPTKSEAIYSDDEEDGGNLEAVDTELHFGGVGLSSTTDNPYGRTGPSGTDLSQLYGQTRKTELDDLIVRRKAMKAERMETRENQVDTFEKMDEQFGELSALLRYRKNEKRPMIPLKPSKEDQEMNEWNLEMREMMGRPKRQATDRTKTPEEIAKDEAERLHQLETRRLARMNGDFDEDDFSDISVDNNKGKSRRSKKLSNEKKKKKTSGQRERNPDEVSDSEDDNDEEGDGVQMMFTSDGLKYFDKDGNVVDKPLQPESKEKGGQHSDSDIDDSNDDDSDSHAEDDDDEDDSNNDNENAAIEPLTIGSRVRGNYRAEEQYGGQEAWYEGKIIKVQKNKKDGSITYDVEYDDGDLEEGMPPQNVRPVEKTSVEKVKESDKQRSETELSLKRKKAKDKARYVRSQSSLFLQGI
jgi:nucleolar protein 14